MSFGRRRVPRNRRQRRRNSSRGQRQRSEGAGRDLFIVIGVFAILALLIILAVAFFAG